MSLSPSETLVDIFPTDKSHSPFFNNTSKLLPAFDPSMSLSSNDFPYLLDIPTGPFKHIIPTPFTLPSPPASVNSDPGLEADLSGSDLSFEPFGLASTPSSTTLISPKSNTCTTSPLSVPLYDESFTADPSAAAALSSHHLQRYFHYKNLAAQAEAAASQQEQFDALLAYTMTGDDRAFNPPSTYDSAPFYGQQTQAFLPYNPVTQQQQATAAAMHAQAQVHMQAHDVALARAQEQRTLSMNYYLPSQRNILETLPSGQPMWNRQSVSSVSSSPYPSTPIAHSEELKITPIVAPSTISEGEQELEEDELSDEHNLPVANPNGGGRGYVPGETPDDPKKKHKCSICGRGFARAFNLKSHVQTHNPLRSKPHQCPHPSCKRGFSRLHDLERHRQGIHSDGPLVDAKRRGVPPSVARAQIRAIKQDKTLGLI